MVLLSSKSKERKFVLLSLCLSQLELLGLAASTTDFHFYCLTVLKARTSRPRSQKTWFLEKALLLE